MTYLIDTNVISEARKGRRAHPGVRRFFRQARSRRAALFLSVVTIGELRRGVDLIRHRGDGDQAAVLEQWLDGLVADYQEYILDLDTHIAQVWGRLCVPHAQGMLDKQIAATALVYDLTVVTRNTKDFQSTGVRLMNPFAEEA